MGNPLEQVTMRPGRTQSGGSVTGRLDHSQHSFSSNFARMERNHDLPDLHGLDLDAFQSDEGILYPGHTVLAAHSLHFDPVGLHVSLRWY